MNYYSFYGGVAVRSLPCQVHDACGELYPRGARQFASEERSGPIVSDSKEGLWNNGFVQLST